MDFQQIPSAWKQAIIVPVHKKGDKHDCKKYRGISLLSIVGRVFTRIIQLRIQERREEAAREEQAGFRPGGGCSDQIFTLQQIMEEHIRCGRRVAIAFIDFVAALDSVNQFALRTTLAVEETPTKIIQLL
ncbi:hypothetical protein Y032_0246g34 [Ancylostoma ceylanicum]|uniref:Reverse transcriptase domain-containing protein n=1 Tax=Ancylostoma ceylanicum TaxID=53326 RepID=A0A016SCX0_9BILA|nr:hypothetical protein Y032_0246g34 [Ancylostoma ceylanicum]